MELYKLEKKYKTTQTKVSGHKIHTQKSTIFIYINNNKLESIMEYKILFINRNG